MNTNGQRHAVRAGLTLLELLIVLTILIALGTIIVPSIGHLGERSQALATRENLCRLQELIVDRYYAEMGELPRPAVDSDDVVLESGSVGGKRADHPQLRYLFVNPDKTVDADTDLYNDRDRGTNLLSSRCWQGPYTMHQGAEYRVDAAANFTTDYGEDGDPTVLDAWGHPVVLQWPTEVPDGMTGDDDAIARVQRQHARLVSAGEDGILDTPPDVLMPDASSDAATGRNDDVIVFLFRHDEHGDGYLSLEQEP
jgi:type II secretory pathway pseudopilin PulG